MDRMADGLTQIAANYEGTDLYAELRSSMDLDLKRLKLYWEDPAATAFGQYAESASAYLTQIEAQASWLAEEGKKAASMLEGLRNAYASLGYEQIDKLIQALRGCRDQSVCLVPAAGGRSDRVDRRARLAAQSPTSAFLKPSGSDPWCRLDGRSVSWTSSPGRSGLSVSATPTRVSRSIRPRQSGAGSTRVAIFGRRELPKSSKANPMPNLDQTPTRPRLDAALRGLATTFRGLTARPDEHNCECHWGSAEELALLMVPDVELEPSLLRRTWWASDWDDHASVLRRILPQLAAALVGGAVETYSDMEEVGHSFARGRWQQWPSEQAAAVREFLYAWWTHTLTDPDAAVPAYDVLAVLVEASGTLGHWLDQWEASTQPAADQRLAEAVDHWQDELLEDRLPWETQVPWHTEQDEEVMRIDLVAWLLRHAPTAFGPMALPRSCCTGYGCSDSTARPAGMTRTSPTGTTA
jgi:hypothetical protein